MPIIQVTSVIEDEAIPRLPYRVVQIVLTVMTSEPQQGITRPGARGRICYDPADARVA